jgi:amino acid transporter
VPTVAANYVPGWVPNLMGWLFLTSVFAAVSAFHSYIARYTYVAGREGLLPRSLGVTHDAFQSPYMGSLVQTVCALIVVALFAILGLDPIANLFTWISQLGTLGVLGMMCLTSISVIAYFSRNKGDGNAFSTMIAPAIAAIVMAVLFVYIFMHFTDLTGAVGALGWVLPSLIPLAFIVGYVRAVMLKNSNPALHAKLGNNV